uniref:Pecanex-like protein n=1 Tax=Syphacia muris TaxID=451379 RepID=A0A0N5AL11_9BILA
MVVIIRFSWVQLVAECWHPDSCAGIIRLVVLATLIYVSVFQIDGFAIIGDVLQWISRELQRSDPYNNPCDDPYVLLHIGICIIILPAMMHKPSCSHTAWH